MRDNKMMNRIIAGLLLGFFLSVSHAESPLAWEQLTVSEQQVLKAYSVSWKKMSAEEQHRLQKIARQWQKMTPEERTAMQQRSARWKQMSEEQKQKVRQNYGQFEQLTPQQQQQIIQRAKMFRDLPEQERQALRQQWESMKQQQHKVINKQQNIKDDKKVSSVKESTLPKKAEEKPESVTPAEETKDSRLDNQNRMQNNRIERQRINRPMGRTR